MKKILFLLLFTTACMHAQTLPNAKYNDVTANTLKIKTPATVTSVNFLSTVEADGSIAKIAPVNLGFISGTGVAGRVPFWSGTNSLSSDSNLYWDNTNKRLGIGTNSPSNPLDIVSSSVKVASFLNTGRLELYNSNGDGSISVLYNLNIPLVNESVGHYAYATKNAAGNLNTTAYMNSWVTNTAVTTMNSALSLSIMADVDTSVGYSQPNLHVIFNKDSFTVPTLLSVIGNGIFNSSIDVTGNSNFRSNLRTLNKAGTNFLNFAARNTTGAETVMDLSNIGTISTAGNATIGGAMDLTGIASLRNTLRFLNKAGNGFVNFAVRNTTGSETVLDLDNIGSAKIVTVPTTSAGTYDFLTRNSSTFTLEKVPSANVATSASVALKADLASPSLTGIPTAPTATAGTNTTQLATTAFVSNALSSGNYTPTFVGVANITSITIQSGASASYTKIGNIVNVSVPIAVQPTATSIATTFTISLPFARVSLSSYSLGGGTITASSGFALFPARVLSSTTTTAEVTYIPSNASAGGGSINFQYDVTK